ncbi:MAG: fused MFS/spermidine synthase [Planctomycetota bacterium]|nr:fused MFS/spermidine synthase [Planctomycetota bacterium]
MRPRLAALVAGLIGFAVMGLELTAVRLFAPYFGDSAYVWTNVIGVVMVALALGAYLGGRMADRDLGRDRLFVLLLTGGLLVAVVPLCAGPLGGWLVPAHLPLDSAMPALVRGSLAATALLFVPPVLLVGCAAPMLVTLLARADGRIGRASGLISWTGTIGSLLGTFAATHVLIPLWGTRETIWFCAACLFVAALLCRFKPAAAAALLVPFLLAWVVPDSLRPVGEGQALLAEVESDYQFLQVVRTGEAGDEQVLLKINEGLDSFHSVAYEGSTFTRGGYYDYHVVMPFLAGDGADVPDLRVLSLGAAAGTFGRLYAHVHKECQLDAVEIDPAVTRLGDEFFQGARPAGDRFALDARVFVDHTQRRYDVVLVDTYKHQIYLPSHVASTQFFSSVERILKDGGVVSVNAGGTRYSDPAVRVLCSTMASIFGVAHAFRVPNSRNFVLLARKGRPAQPDCLAKVSAEDPDLSQILKVMGRSSAWRTFRTAQAAGDEVLDDNRPFLDQLQEEVYSRVETTPQSLRMDGPRLAEEVLAEVEHLYGAGRIEAALAALQTSSQATGPLRQYAGNCRWMLRDAGGAVLEYKAAQQLGVSGMDRNIEGAQAEFDSRLEAWAVRDRNAWVALGSVVLLLGFSATLRLW